MPWLLAILPAAALLWLLFTRWETSYNYRCIQADGAKNSLRFWFHLRRLLVRVSVALVLATGGAWAAPVFWLAFAGHLAGFGGWFLYAFTQGLNKLRGLDPYYVSASPTTAWLDRKLWARAVAAIPRGPFNDAELVQERNRYAGKLLRRLLRVALGAGLVGYGVALVLIWLRLPVAG